MAFNVCILAGFFNAQCTRRPQINAKGDLIMVVFVCHVRITKTKRQEMVVYALAKTPCPDPQTFLIIPPGTNKASSLCLNVRVAQINEVIIGCLWKCFLYP